MGVEKQSVTAALLERGPVLVRLDPRVPGTMVPRRFTKDPQMTLCVGYALPVPIPDLSIDAAGIGGTLSFNREQHYCFIPWQSVFAITGQDMCGRAWPEDAPPSVRGDLTGQSEERPPTRRKRQMPPYLRVVK